MEGFGTDLVGEGDGVNERVPPDKLNHRLDELRERDLVAAHPLQQPENRVCGAGRGA